MSLLAGKTIMLLALHETGRRFRVQIPTQKIGTTRSGLVIYTFTTDDWDLDRQQTKDYKAEDHFDAWVIFERLIVRELRRLGDKTADYSRFFRYSDFHWEIITPEFIQAEKLRLGLATSPDLVRFAAKLTEDVFLD